VSVVRAVGDGVGPMQLNPRVRRRVGLGVVGALMALAGALWIHWPWLRAEHARLPPTLAAGMWVADGLAVAGLIWFGVRYAVLGRPGRPSRPSRLALAIGLVLTMGVDLAAGLAVAAGEVAGRDRAVATAGQIIGGRPTVNGEKAYLRVGFQDANGAWRESELQVRLADQQAPIQAAVAGGQFPIPVSVHYDPDWPPRCWLDGFNNEEDNRLYWLSMVFLLFQGIGVPIALLYGHPRLAGATVPLAQAVPAVAELVPLALAAAVKFAVGEC
jgi:hypothetical protein